MSLLSIFLGVFVQISLLCFSFCSSFPVGSDQMCQRFELPVFVFLQKRVKVPWTVSFTTKIIL